MQKHRNVVVGILPRIASRTRAKEHDALNAVAVDFCHGGAEALQDGIVLRFCDHIRHCSTTFPGDSNPQLSISATRRSRGGFIGLSFVSAGPARSGRSAPRARRLRTPQAL